MLHKRFKSAKCKTGLKLATSRIKLMRNKKSVQIVQMKKDLAHLLETGQERTARIRVEHVIREEKMMAAYDLIEIYCELVVARLPIIESQKTCPMDLKEAVTSVIFAAPRCSDISELVDIKKQFTAKYGKEFVSAALELHPDCGVSRMLVEKLSAVAPDLQTKIKVLSAVAKDHNIDWDPTSFEEKEAKPASDLLNGPGNFGNASKANVDPPKIIQPVHTHEEKPNAPINFSEQNKKYTQSTENVSSTHSGGETSSSGVTYERSEMRQNWNLEFKDATHAAQAAAESAERAAIAARAAAQFSSQEKITNSRPSGPHSSINRDKPSHVSAPSGSDGESSSDDEKPTISNHHIDNQHATSQKATERFDGFTDDSDEGENVVSNFHVPISRDRPHVPAPSGSSSKSSINYTKSNMLNQHIDENQHDVSAPISRDRPHVSAPSGSSSKSSLIDTKTNILNQHADQSQHDTSQRTTERFDTFTNESVVDEKLVNNFHTSDGYFEESLHEDQEGPPSPESVYKTELVSGQNESTENENINYFATEKQATIRSSHSHASTSSDEVDAGKKSVVGNPFAFIHQETHITDEAISDENDDDDDDVGPRFDSGFDYDGIEDTHSLENSHIWSPKVNTVDQPISRSHIFSESTSFGNHSIKSVAPSETDNPEPASFDDGPDSESESELLSLKPEPSSFVEPQQAFNSRKTRIELNDLVEMEPHFEDEVKQMQPQLELKKHNFDQESFDMEDNNDSLNQGLSFGTLTGGLRNKGGLRFPLNTKSATIEKSTEESSITGSQTSVQSYLDSRVNRIEDKKPKASIPISDSESDSDLNEKAKQANTRSLFTPPAAVFNDDGGDPEVEAPKQVQSKARLGSGLSRRTRGPPSVPSSKTHVEPKPEPRSMPETVVPAEPQAYTRKFKAEDTEQTSESHKPFSAFIKTVTSGETKSTSSEPQVSHSAHTKQEPVKIMPESKYSLNERVSSRVVESSKLKNAKTQNLRSERSAGENLVNSPSHVHPKLPDYDSLAARLQSLRTDRQ